MRLLRDELQLPLIYGPSRYGSNTYTGFWVGNAYLEPTGHLWQGADPPPVRFFGLTFNPSSTAERSSLELDRRGLAHNKPSSWASPNEQARLVFVQITDLSSENLAVSLMEELEVEKVKEENQAANDRLQKNGGGSLGVVALEEVLVADTADRVEKWCRLLRDPRYVPESEKAWNPVTGPLIRLTSDQAPGIKSVTLRVRSLESAARYLASRNMLGRREAALIELSRGKTLGLSIRLTE